MAREIKPGKAPEIKAKLVDVKMPSFKALDDMGDAQIKAANQNFALYADTLVKTESAKLFEQYKADPVQLSNALSKIPNMLTGLPEGVQEEMNQKLYLNSVALVQKAQNNYLVAQDEQTRQQASTSVEQSRALLAESYQNVLQNAMSDAATRNEVMNDIFIEQRMNLDKLTELTDHTGKSIYSDSQIKAIKNIDDIELAGFKQFFDTMLLNDNDELERSKKYYQEFMLAPERFMADNYMNRKTYDKARAYAEKELRRAGADIQKARFNQSIRDYTRLQLVDEPGVVDSLKQSGFLPREMIKQMEKVNVKFNEIDPSKTESPVAMLDLLRIINDTEKNPAPMNNDEQQKILEQGTATLDAIAEYAQAYGLGAKSVQRTREAVVNWETNTAFAPIMNNFAEIINDFDVKLNKVRRQSTGKDKGKLAFLTSMSDNEYIKLIQLNNLFANATDTINQQIRNQDWDGVRQTQREVQKQAAQIKYGTEFGGWIDWKKYEENPDQIFTAPNGRVVKVKDFTFDGDVQFEIVE